MPQAVLFIGGVLGSSVATAGLGAFLFANATLIGYTALAGAIVASAGHQRRKAKRQFNESLKDRLIMTSSTDGQRSRVYGPARNVDGVLFKATRGEHNEIYTLVVALAGHEVHAIDDIYFNDSKVTLGTPVNGWYPVATAPWGKSVRKSAQALITITNGDGSVVLPFLPVSNSVSVTVQYGGTNGSDPAPFTLDGQTVTISGFGVPLFNGSATVDFQYDEVEPKAWVQLHTGATSQDLSGILQPLHPDLITSEHRFAGIACIVVELHYDQDAFPTGVPTISAKMRGAKVYDPRTGLTEYSDNPSLIARDWALYAHGGAIPSTAIDDPAVIAAANACDTDSTFTTADGPVTIDTYRCGIVCRTDQDPWMTMGEIVESMAGRIGWSGGLLTWKAGMYSAPVETITEDWLGGQREIKIVPEPPTEEAINVYRPTISDEEQDYVAIPTGEVRATGYITADGRELPQDITLGGVTNKLRAQHICGVLMRDARNGLTVELPCNLRAFKLQLFDTVTVTLPRFGWSSKEFEVRNWEFSLDGGVVLLLKETAASIFQPDALFTSTDSTPNTFLPLPTNVPEVGDLNVSSGSSALSDGSIMTRTKVRWPAVNDESITNSGRIELQYKLAGSSGAGFPPVFVPNTTDEWHSLFESGSSIEMIIPGLKSSWVYVFRARAINTLGVRGVWSKQATHLIAAPPGLDYTNMTGRPALFRVVAIGFNSTQHPVSQGLYDGETNAALDSSANGSYTVHVIDRATSALISSSAYQVLNSTAQAEEMAQALNALGSDKIVVIRSYDEPQTNRLTPNLRIAMMRCGASEGVYGSPQFKFRSAYILIGIAGCGSSNGFEAYQGDTDNDANAWCDVTFQLKSGNLIVTGMGATPRTLADYSYTGDLDATKGADWNTNLSNRPALFRVVSRGFSDTARPVEAGFYNGETGILEYGALRSYNFVRLRRSDGSITAVGSYDVFGDNGSTGANEALAAALNATGTDSIAVVYTFDEPQNWRFQEGLLTAMLRCGASRAVFGSPQFKVRGAYILVGIGDCGEGNGFEAYNGAVDNDTHAWCDTSFFLKSGQLVISGTTATPRTLADYSYTGDLNATSDLSLIPGGDCIVNGNTATKVSGVGAWDSHVYSRDSSTGGAFASVRAVAANANVMFGLNTDPTTDQSYTSIDYAIFLRNDGLLDAYESGAAAAAIGTYAANDVLQVTYDGFKVRYFKNGTVLREVAAAANLKLSLDSSFFHPGASLTNMRFGPLSGVAGISTGQAAPDAFTEVLDVALPADASNTRKFSVGPFSFDCKLRLTAYIRNTSITPSAGFTKKLTTTYLYSNVDVSLGPWLAQNAVSYQDIVGQTPQVTLPEFTTVAVDVFSYQAVYGTVHIGLRQVLGPTGTGGGTAGYGDARVIVEVIKR
jgi:hypothetical protein